MTGVQTCALPIYWHSESGFDDFFVNGSYVKISATQWVRDAPCCGRLFFVVPLEGAGGKLTSTISSPIQVHGVSKVPAKRAPALGEHNQEVLEQLGFTAAEIDGLRASGAVPKVAERAAAAE